MRREAMLLSPSYSRLGMYQIYNYPMEDFSEMKYLNISSFFLRENERVKERLSTRKTLQRESKLS